MELRRTAAALLRPQSHFLSFLYPSTLNRSALRIPSAAQPSAFHIRDSCRYLTTSHVCRQQATAAAPEPEPEHEEDSSKDATNNFLDKALESHEKPAIATSTRTTRHKSILGQYENRSTTRTGFQENDDPSSNFPPTGSYARDKLNDLFGERRSQPSLTDNDNLQDWYGLVPKASDSKSSGLRQIEVPPPSPIRLNSALGRSLPILEKETLGRGLQKLEMVTAKNRVRRELNKQRFHERPGLKRKRLRSERWRRRFKEDFSRVVDRVVELKNKGW